MKEPVKLTREYEATLEDVWEMWTTKDGIESFWGPDGFTVEVRQLELRPQGELHYAMIAKAPEMVAFMQREGMPIAQECRLTFTEVQAPRRLAYIHLVDFVPGHEPYDTTHVVELEQIGERVKLTLTFDRMHDEDWTNRATMGWKNELGKLEQALRARASGRASR